MLLQRLVDQPHLQVEAGHDAGGVQVVNLLHVLWLHRLGGLRATAPPQRHQVRVEGQGAVGPSSSATGGTFVQDLVQAGDALLLRRPHVRDKAHHHAMHVVLHVRGKGVILLFGLEDVLMRCRGQRNGHTLQPFEVHHTAEGCPNRAAASLHILKHVVHRRSPGHASQCSAGHQVWHCIGRADEASGLTPKVRSVDRLVELRAAGPRRLHIRLAVEGDHLAVRVVISRRSRCAGFKAVAHAGGINHLLHLVVVRSPLDHPLHITKEGHLATPLLFA
mmetsp:Transcript_71684/g.171199  ORF Transcript_71684/g.171199 Transcript_71684/m.171199 type:complete len:276 (+) Transcript_71684:2179-3006(+)